MMATAGSGASGVGGAGASGTGASGTGGTNTGGLVPDSAHCMPAADWDPAWVMFEDEVLRLSNEYRAMGFNCDTEGEFGPAPPLVTQPNLRCSARLHSQRPLRSGGGCCGRGWIRRNRRQRGRAGPGRDERWQRR
jgi:hypothetical protein